MTLKVTKASIYHAALADQPGGLAEKLDALAQSGANLDFVVARRSPDRPGKGVVFVAPVSGARQIKAAKAAGFKVGESPALRVLTANVRGAGAKMTCALAEAGINLHGLSAGAIGKQAVAYLRFDSARDATKAMKVLRKVK